MKSKTSEDRGIIYPVKGKGEPYLGPDAIMVIIPSELKYLVRVSKAEKVHFSDMNLYNLYQTRRDSEAQISLSGPFLGAPHAAIAIEKLIVLGAKRIWVLGWCGSLQPTLRIGDLVIPTSAISEEGTSGHYPIGEKAIESDLKLNRMLEKILEKQNISFSKGSVWTTDGLYRETPNKVKKFQARGVLAVEMEISALMTIALYRSIAMAGLLVVSDEIFDFRWRPGFSNPLVKKNSHAAGKVLLSLANSLSQNEKNH